jgi:hypothetical protein
MEHLTNETLARLVDEAPDAGERAHLNRCRRCRDELDAMQAQTLGLSHLPDLRPPRGDWESLEVRLRGEGLVRGTLEHDGRRAGGDRRRRGGQGWFQAAAAAALLLAGAGAGAGGVALAGGLQGGASPSADLRTPRAGAEGASLASLGTLDLPSVQAALGVAPTGDDLTVEEAEALVRATEGWYLSALLRYRERAGVGGQGGGRAEWDDPVSRYAALETLMAAGQAAINEVPADPFLNGLLLNVRAEREAVLRGMRADARDDGEWY